MSERRIPEKVTYICDGCKAESQSKFDTDLTIVRRGRDFSGHVVGGFTVERLLCDTCVDRVNEFFLGGDNEPT